MGGPGSGKRAASRGGSRGGSRRGSRGGSRGGSQIRGRGGATASSIQDQLLYEDEEEQRIIDSMQGQENDSDENQMSGEEEVGPDKEDQAIEVQIPKDAVPKPTFEKTKWPLWRHKLAYYTLQWKGLCAMCLLQRWEISQRQFRFLFKFLTAFKKSSRGRVRKNESRREKSLIRPIFHEEYSCDEHPKR